MSSDIKILIVDDEPLIAEDLNGHLRQKGFSNLQIAFDSNSALDILNTQSIDIALLDVNLNENKTGIDIANHINMEIHIPFIYITSYADRDTIHQIKNTHPVGYIMKPFNAEEVGAVIEIGMELFYKYIGNKNDLDISGVNKYATDPLTNKELEILEYLAQGYTNQQIADKSFVSINTIKTHLKNIFLKLEVNNRTEAATLISRLQKK